MGLTKEIQTTPTKRKKYKKPKQNKIAMPVSHISAHEREYVNESTGDLMMK